MSLGSSNTSSSSKGTHDANVLPRITPAVDISEQDGYNMPFTTEDDRITQGKGPEIIKRNLKVSTTNNETLVHILKGMIGSGILAMPQAFMNSGIWTGVILTPLLGVVCIHSMFLLVKTSKELCKRAGVPALSYEESAVAAFEYGPKNLRKYAKAVGYLITTFLLVTQTGFCCVYFVFIPQNLKQALDCMTTSGTGISQLGFMAITIIPVMLVCYIPNLKLLAPVSLLASVIQFISLFMILYYLVRDLPMVNEQVPAFNSWSTIPLYLSTAVYAFEGIGLILPLENKMKTPKAIGGLNGVLNTGMSITLCLYITVGFFGYLAYGNDVQGSITLNLPPREGLAQAVKIMMALSIFFTYPLMMYVTFEIGVPVVTRIVEGKKKKLLVEYIFRTALVLLTFALAAAIPNIGLFISLIGAVSSSALAVIFPPIMEAITFWPDKGKYNYRIIKAVLMVVFGLLTFVTGTITSVQEIIKFFVNGEESPPFEC
ncbi:proton-coupled amino acid transporter-like protein pathetic isoform X2 [Palaemon carinicauda]|uniref:proton-coupled amino acid transporter-like protein pathetic isoform X2 n=1 Tax=Palaemon carinicauda TaxID=392227 RepID=UPI0035B66920